MITEKLLQICKHLGNRLRLQTCKVHIVVTPSETDLWHLISAVSKKVLIVEDDNDLVKLLKYNLEKEGFRVNYATDGTVALSEARRDPPDLVILDLMLPGLDGLEVCRQLRRADRFARTPVLILSARNDEADRGALLQERSFRPSRN